MLHLLVAVLLTSNGTGKTLVRAQPGTLVTRADDLVAYIPFNVPGCYPSGTAMGTRGEKITIVRAGTKVCGSLTCQANEACVDTDGLAEPVNIVNPLAGKNPTTWCVEMIAKPSGGAAWPTGNFRIWGTGTAGGANTMLATSYLSGRLLLDTFDSAGANKNIQPAHNYAAGSAHRISYGDYGGTLVILSDGVLLGSGGTGAGTGVIATQAATMYLESQSDGTNVFAGFIRELKIRKGACR